MTVRRLALLGWRNLAETALVPCPGVNVFHGENAQGKTNLLEAVWMFTGARSFRGAHDGELPRLGQKQAALSLSFSAQGRAREAALRFDGGARKAALGGVALQSPAGLSGEFCAVIFSPEHLSLIKDGPAVRRRFLDAAICPMRPRHAAVAAAYQKALTQRAALLRDIPRHGELYDTLDVWDARLARLGALLVHARLRYLARLLPKAARLHSAISEGREQADFSYETAPALQSCVQNAQAKPAEIEQALLAALRERRRADIETGVNGVGPHRDDLCIRIGGLPARTYASQGQQRTAALALKLAEAELLGEVVGEPPVLLLDDVLSELDPARQAYLLGHIERMQVFLTCCDARGLQNAAGAAFTVQDGRVTPD